MKGAPRSICLGSPGNNYVWKWLVRAPSSLLSQREKDVLLSSTAARLMRPSLSTLGFACLIAVVASGCSESEPVATEPRCAEYCEKVVECYPMYPDACAQECSEDAERELGISFGCASAAAAERACVGALTSCEEIASWGYRYPADSHPCLAEASAADAQCERPCEEHDECVDDRECTGDVCYEGRCLNDASWCPCEAPLSVYCERAECRSWDEAVAVAETCLPHWRAVAGECGDFRYITMYWGFDESTQYFGASGELVARFGCTDCNCIQCGPGHDTFCIHYGPVPECEKEGEQLLCEEPW